MEAEFDLGDIIQKVDGEPVRVFDDLARILDRHQVGDRMSPVEIKRNKRIAHPNHQTSRHKIKDSLFPVSS